MGPPHAASCSNMLLKLKTPFLRASSKTANAPCKTAVMGCNALGVEKIHITRNYETSWFHCYLCSKMDSKITQVKHLTCMQHIANTNTPRHGNTTGLKHE